MNPRQRRGVLLLALSVLGAVGVFVAVSAYVADVRSQVEPLVTVYELAADLGAYEEITDAALAEREVPSRWVPATAVRSREELVGRVAAAPLSSGSLLQADMVVDRPEIASGQREIAILVDAETGVAGKIRPGDRVDIFATFAGDEGDEGEENPEPPSSRIVVPSARIIDVGTPTVQEDDTGTAFEEQQVVPITFSLEVFDSLALTFVESYADSVRLALVAPGDDEELQPEERRFELRDLEGLIERTAQEPASPSEADDEAGES